MPTPVVRLNHAVAVAMAHGEDAGLSLVDVLGREGDLDGYHLYWSTRGELLRRKGERGAARRAFQRARTLATSPAERAFLTRRLASLDDDAGRPRVREFADRAVVVVDGGAATVQRGPAVIPRRPFRLACLRRRRTVAKMP